MHKVLVVSTLGRHFRYFGQYDYKVLKELGYEVHAAANFKVKEYDRFEEDGVIRHQIDFKRNPFSFKNIVAYFQLKKIFKENNFKLVHCQSPTAGFFTRMAFLHFRNKERKIIYTAHGFHFFKGAPLINWILFYPVEKCLSRVTDALITINNEDYLISKRKFKCKTYKIPSIGIEVNKYSRVENYDDLERLRNEIGLSIDDFVLIFVGELNKNKNQIFLIRCISELLKRGYTKIKLLLVGEGPKMSEYKYFTIKNRLQDNVIFCGYRNDVPKLFSIANISVSSSYREGLPVNVLEAMASGLPLIVTKCRGNADLVTNGENGYIIDFDDEEAFVQAVIKLYNDRKLLHDMGKKSKEMILHYSLENVQEQMKSIYNDLL